MRSHVRPHRSSTPVRRTRASPDRRRYTQEEYVGEYMDRENYQEAYSDGKNNLIRTMHGHKAIYKPYMYMVREGLHTSKQKIEVRHKMLEYEYINATLRLALDKQATDPKDKDGILNHLVDVTRDLQFRKWEPVRKWSQGVWDRIEGEPGFSWESTQAIQNERFYKL